MWLIRYLLFAPAQRLLLECAMQTLADFGDSAEQHLRRQVDPGTPASGRLLIWLLIRKVRRQRMLGSVRSAQAHQPVG